MHPWSRHHPIPPRNCEELGAHAAARIGKVVSLTRLLVASDCCCCCAEQQRLTTSHTFCLYFFDKVLGQENSGHGVRASVRSDAIRALAKDVLSSGNRRDRGGRAAPSARSPTATKSALKSVQSLLT